MRKPPARGAATGRFAAITADTAARDPKKRPSSTLVTGSYIPITVLLHSWGSLFGVPMKVSEAAKNMHGLHEEWFVCVMAWSIITASVPFLHSNLRLVGLCSVESVGPQKQGIIAMFGTIATSGTDIFGF